MAKTTTKKAADKEPADKAPATKSAETKAAAKTTDKAAEKEPAKKTGAAAKEKGTSTGKAHTKASPKVAGTPKAKPSSQPPSAFSKPLTPSKELAAVVGNEPLARTVVVSKVWEYIKENNLQNEKNKREILADDKLKAVFGKDKVTMFEMNKHLAAHLKS